MTMIYSRVALKHGV